MTAVVFKGLNTLNFQEVRMNIVRVPEVLSSIRRAQRLWDDNSEKYFDILNYIVSDDAVFLGNIKSRNLCKAIIKIGLYHRYIRKYDFPKFLLGDISCDQALLNCAGQLEFEKLIKEYITQDTLQLVKHSEPGVISLTGDYLDEWACFEFNQSRARFEPKKLGSTSLSGAVEELLEAKEVDKLVNIGPDSLSPELKRQFEMNTINFVEALDEDPLLDWFWPSLAPLESNVAQ
ncbi:MAG: hypothetical protein HOO06_12160 [Bdellovibrionaceae bacterium]|jgi:hypothetical protein|nr:hypothetical protein [Pseudobdellovibrionaceae bacterium]